MSVRPHVKCHSSLQYAAQGATNTVHRPNKPTVMILCRDVHDTIVPFPIVNLKACCKLGKSREHHYALTGIHMWINQSNQMQDDFYKLNETGDSINPRGRMHNYVKGDIIHDE